jgi:nicotinic acid phosphoribosyltransferase
MLKNNIILNSDSYKYSQWNQYPEGTEHVYSYIESRGGIYDKVSIMDSSHFFTISWRIRSRLK